MLRPVQRLAVLGFLTILASLLADHPAAAHDLIYRWQRQMTPWPRLTREERCLPPTPRQQSAPRYPYGRGGYHYGRRSYEYHPEETGFGYYDALNKSRSKDWRTRLPGLNNTAPETKLEPLPSLDRARQNLLEDLQNDVPPNPAPPEPGVELPEPQPVE
jgi:hypothetical protein